MTLSQIWYWLAASTSFMPPLPYHIFQAWQIVGQSFYGWVYIYVSLLIAYRVPLCTKETRSQGWRLHVDISSTSSCSISSVGVCPQQWGIAFSLRSQPFALAKSDLFGDFHGTPWAEDSIDCNPVLLLKASMFKVLMHNILQWMVALYFLTNC